MTFKPPPGQLDQSDLRSTTRRKNSGSLPASSQRCYLVGKNAGASCRGLLVGRVLRSLLPGSLGALGGPEPGSLGTPVRPVRASDPLGVDRKAPAIVHWETSLPDGANQSEHPVYAAG